MRRLEQMQGSLRLACRVAFQNMRRDHREMIRAERREQACQDIGMPAFTPYDSRLYRGAFISSKFAAETLYDLYLESLGKGAHQHFGARMDRELKKRQRRFAKEAASC